jgi:hypothetical protein
MSTSSLGLAIVLVLHAPGSGQKDTASALPNTKEAHSALLGDLRIRVTAVKPVSGPEIQQYAFHARTGYHIVLAFVNFKNVGRYPSCSRFDEWLLVKQGSGYRRFPGGRAKGPQANNLPPGEESSGIIAFEMKDGMEPIALKLVRNLEGEEVCTLSQHRVEDISGPESVSLSLQGLPAKAE